LDSAKKYAREKTFDKNKLISGTARTANIGLLQAGGVCVIESVWFFITFIMWDRAQVLNARLQQARTLWAMPLTIFIGRQLTTAIAIYPPTIGRRKNKRRKGKTTTLKIQWVKKYFLPRST
jgi:hypothetical protein